MAGDDSELRLPPGGEFSPGQINLRRVLQLAVSHEGDVDALVEAIRSEYFAEAAERRTNLDARLKQQRQRARNVLIGMQGYGLLTLRTGVLTEAGRELAMIEDERELHRSFARHVLRNLPGLDVLEAVRSLHSRHEKLTKATLALELISRGYRLPRATTHHTVLLSWLREAESFDSQGNVNEEQVADLAGITLTDRSDWSGLTTAQRALLRALKTESEHSGSGFLSAKLLVDKAEQMHGKVFPEDQLRAKVFRPLQDAGWIELSETSGGRGGKSGQIAPTERLLGLDTVVLGEDLATAIPADLRARLDTPLDQIYADLDSTDKYVKGIALELLAVRVATTLGLRPVQLRLRGPETGGAEVDLLAEGAHLLFSRWLFQCKNTTSKVGVSALAKEVGMALLLRAHVVVLVTRGTVGATVSALATQVGETTPMQVVLVEGDVLGEHRKRGPSALLEFFQQQATSTLKLKRPQILGKNAADE